MKAILSSIHFSLEWEFKIGYLVTVEDQPIVFPGDTERSYYLLLRKLCSTSLFFGRSEAVLLLTASAVPIISTDLSLKTNFAPDTRSFDNFNIVLAFSFVIY